MGIPGQALLWEARALIGRGWTQHADARDGGGNAVEPWDEVAISWSLLGALVAVLERQADTGRSFAIGELAAACVSLADIVEETSLESWNDHPERTQREVLGALKGAADAAEGDFSQSSN